MTMLFLRRRRPDLEAVMTDSFQSESDYAGIPYRVLQDGSVEALMPNGDVVNFGTVEQFVASANRQPCEEPDANEQRREEPDAMRLDQPLVNGEATQNLPVSAKPLDYYSLLLDTIKKTQNNSAQIRQLIYERMRFNFKRDLLFGHSTLGLTDIVRHVNDFELAVTRIEANAVHEEPKQQERVDYEPTISPLSGEIDVYSPPKPVPQVYASDDLIRNSYVLRQPRKISLYKVFGYSALGIAILAAILAVTVRVSQKPAVEAANEAAKISAAVKQEIVSQKKEKELPFLIPSSYGIYALSNNQLVALQTLPIGIPDPRVSLSAELTKPSETTLSDNKPAFILFRRDLLNNAPQTLAVRVIARVMRETKVVGGKATTTKIEGTWRIRNVSHELKVSPVPGQPEMIMAKGTNDAPLPAGRYALVLNRAGYDFTIAGKEEAPEFCLEGFEASNGSIFTQCKAP